MAAKGRANGDAIVAGDGQLELYADDHVLILVLAEQIAAFAGLANNRAVFHFVAVDGSLPVAQVLAIDQFGESVGIARLEFFVGFLRADLADEQISPADLAAVRLQLDRPFGEDRVGYVA